MRDFIEEVLGDKPGFDRPYERGDSVTDVEGRKWTLVLDLGVDGSDGCLRWLYKELYFPGSEFGFNRYRDEFPGAQDDSPT